MPRLVVLTSSAAPASASARSPPVDHLDRAAECRCEGVGVVTAAIDQADGRRAVIEQRGHHGAGRAAGAEHDGGTSAGAPSGLRRTQILAKAEYIGVAALERAVGADDHRVDRTDARRNRVDLIDDGKRRLLVRHGEIAAGEIRAPRARAAMRRDLPA